jgi:hypothetical protein
MITSFRPNLSLLASISLFSNTLAFICIRETILSISKSCHRFQETNCDTMNHYFMSRLKSFLEPELFLRLFRWFKSRLDYILCIMTRTQRLQPMWSVWTQTNGDLRPCLVCCSEWRFHLWSSLRSTPPSSSQSKSHTKWRFLKETCFTTLVWIQEGDWLWQLRTNSNLLSHS